MISLPRKSKNSGLATFDPDQVKICKNCGNSNPGKYCAACGQGFEDVSKPFWNILGDLAGIFSLDASIFRTIGPFFFKPGFLASEFLDGRRKKYMSPVRLYLFISIVFFFVLGFTARSKMDSSDNSQNISFTNDSVASVIKEQAINEIHKADTAIAYQQSVDSVVSKIDNFQDTAEKLSTEKEQFVEKMMKMATYAMYILMPLFALLLKLLYIRRKHFYIEHLVFSVNMHAFVMLFISIISLLNLWLPGGNEIYQYMILIIPVYITAGMKRFYGQKLLKTILKLFILGFLYTILLIAALTIIAVISGNQVLE